MEAEEGGGEEYGSRKSTRDKKQSDVTTDKKWKPALTQCFGAQEVENFNTRVEERAPPITIPSFPVWERARSYSEILLVGWRFPDSEAAKIWQARLHIPG